MEIYRAVVGSKVGRREYKRRPRRGYESNKGHPEQNESKNTKGIRVPETRNYNP